jgi:hypothetical protein
MFCCKPVACCLLRPPSCSALSTAAAATCT